MHVCVRVSCGKSFRLNTAHFFVSLNNNHKSDDQFRISEDKVQYSTLNLLLIEGAAVLCGFSHFYNLNMNMHITTDLPMDFHIHTASTDLLGICYGTTWCDRERQRTEFCNWGMAASWCPGMRSQTRMRQRSSAVSCQPHLE